MTDSLTGGLRLGPHDRLTLYWDGDVWHTTYTRYDSKTYRKVGYGTKQGMPGETAEEVARGAMQDAVLRAAQLNEAPK